MTTGTGKARPAVKAALAALAAVLIGCASQSGGPQSPTQAIQATTEIPRDQILDVGIEVFDPGLPPQGQPMPDDIFPELREAEARYMAIRLENTMQSTGHWGAVRVLPSGRGTTDLKVTGTILVSTGSTLALDIRAVDVEPGETLSVGRVIQAGLDGSETIVARGAFNIKAELTKGAGGHSHAH